MGTPSGENRASTTLRNFSVWPGVLIGLLVAFALVGAEAFWPFPPLLTRLLGGTMVLAHGMIAFAVITLFGQALILAGWERQLVERRGNLAANHGMATLLDSPDESELREEVDRTTREVSIRRREIRGIGLVVIYLVPLFGFVATIRVRARGDRHSWSIAEWPLLLNLGEAFFVLLLILSVSNAFQAIRGGWLSLLNPAPHSRPEMPQAEGKANAGSVPP